MKQFFTNVAANLATVALLVLLLIMLAIGFVAAAGGDGGAPTVPQGALLVVDLGQSLADRPAERTPTSALDRARAEPGGAKLSLRAAVVALQQAATDERISGVLIRGNVVSDGLSSGYGGLVEFRQALVDFRATGKPIHAYMIDPTVRDYYLTSAASVITMEPFGTMQFGGLAATQLHFAGFFEKYGIGIQVSRVGKFKAAVEPYTRPDMSPENREQTRRYLNATWDEIKERVGASRNLPAARLQQLADSLAIFTPQDALTLGLVDRVAPFDMVLRDLRALTSGVSTDTPAASDTAARAAVEDSVTSELPTGAGELPRSIPQIMLRDYAQLAVVKADNPTARRRLAIVYAQGEIVNGEGGTDQIGGAAFARELRALRHNTAVRAVVLRVNSPGGSVTASEEIQRELELLNAQKPVVVSMGTLAASGGYWISTAARRVFAQSSTLTGSIGVFAIFPNLQGLAEKNGITVDTVNTARYADMFSITRPRTTTELALVQRGIDAVYEAFMQRVATARNLPLDSVRVIAEGRVWAGDDALAIGLVDEIGDLEDAVAYAANAAQLGSDYRLLEVPKVKGTSEILQDLFNDSPPPVIGRIRAMLGLSDDRRSAALRTLSPATLDTWGQLSRATGPVGAAVRTLTRDLGGLLLLDDPRSTYARMPFALQIQ